MGHDFLCLLIVAESWLDLCGTKSEFIIFGSPKEKIKGGTVDVGEVTVHNL